MSDTPHTQADSLGPIPPWHILHRCNISLNSYYAHVGYALWMIDECPFTT